MMEEIIKKAIEGGGFVVNSYYYQSKGDRMVKLEYFMAELGIFEDENGFKHRIHYGDMVLAPTFWQALGKASKWGEEMVLIDEAGHPKEWCFYEFCPVCEEIVTGERQECPNECETDSAPIIAWEKYGVQFHGINLTQGWEKAVEWLSELTLSK